MVFCPSSISNTRVSIPNFDDPVDSDSSELRSKLTGFEIKIGLTGIESKRLVFQLVVDPCSIEIDFSGDHLVNKRYKFKRYTTHVKYL